MELSYHQLPLPELLFHQLQALPLPMELSYHQLPLLEPLFHKLFPIPLHLFHQLLPLLQLLLPLFHKALFI
jgi:hypothetical protein